METLSTTDSSLHQRGMPVNPVLGKVDSLSYQGNGNNLVEVKIRENNSGNIYTYTFAASDDTSSDFSTIKIVNLNDFCFRLQEAFNNQSLVSIFHEDDKLVLLEFTREVFSSRGAGGSSGGSGGSGGP